VNAVAVPRRFVLAGHPVAHSKSPAMHRAAYRAMSLPHSYEARDVDAAGFAALVDELRRGAIDGINVTVPYKRRALELADEHDVVAERAGAANTLARNAEGHVVASNTDVPALEAELMAMGAPSHGRALILGAGGAARAALLALGGINVARATVRARDLDKARALASLGVELSFEPLAPGDEREITLVIQTTSAGMHGADDGEPIARAVDWENLPHEAVAYDVVYAPPVTPFVRAARARGLRAESGMSMLVRQGALAFEQWLGLPAPIETMRAATE
jgi:shikimate dehydrogenase